MKLFLVTFLFLASKMLFAGGDWIGNGGGQEEIEVYYQLHRLPHYTSQVLSFNKDESVKKIHFDILQFNIEEKNILFVDEELKNSNFLFSLEKNEIRLSRPHLWSLAEKPGWKSKTIIRAFLEAFYRDKPNSPSLDPFLGDLDNILDENTLIPVPSESHPDTGVSIFKTTDQFEVLAFDGLRSTHVTPSLLESLMCPENGKAQKINDIKNFVWRLDLAKQSSSKNEVLFAQSTVEYFCGRQTIISELIIEFKLIDGEIFEWSFLQWDIH